MGNVANIMNEEIKKQIEEIKRQIQCPKHFKCVKSGFEVLCKAKKTNYGEHLECLEPNPRDCAFAVDYDNGYFCNCQLRLFLSMHLSQH